MEWSERMNAAVDYIENNLTGEIDFSKAAEKAYCSVSHFHRIFLAINGLTPVEYARRRRLTLAATEISSGSYKIIDIATKYGYDSPSAFTRAFRNLHGVTPMAAREPGVKLTAYPRIFFNIELKGGIDMDYRIMNKPAFDVVGRSKKFTTRNMEQAETIPQFWEEFSDSAEYQKLVKLGGGKPGPVTRADIVCAILPNEENTWDPITYTICIEKTDDTTDFDVYHIPAATWAIFESVGPMPGAIQDITRKIFQEWFPATGYEHDNKPELEVYFPGDPNSPEYRCQVWMPVIKK